MRPAKFLSILVFVTGFSLAYVWLQTEIFYLAYEGQNRAAVFEDLIDKNAVLRYNIQRNASLVCIGNKVGRTAGFQMPDSYRLVRLIPGQRTLVAGKQLPKKENLLVRFFSVNRQAEANTINR